MRRIARGVCLVVAGVLCWLGAAGFVFFNNEESEKAGEASQLVYEAMAEQMPETKPRSAARKAAAADAQAEPELKTVEVDGSSYVASLEIPALGMSLPIHSDWSYELLKTAPCRYSGSPYTNDLVICAHNYSSHFSNLFSIDMGTDVYVTTVDGVVFHYRVANRETLQPEEVERMTVPDGDWDMTLFTCYYGGATRCTVRCVLAD